MYLQTHVLMGAALFGRRDLRGFWAAAAGGLLPDLPQVAVQVVAFFKGIPAALVFVVLYFQSWWQITQAVAHDFWLWGGLLVLCLAMTRRCIDPVRGRWQVAAGFAASGLLHCAVDFLTQREEAHMQFWPVTRWVFVSPVSHQDPAHFGTAIGVLELAMGVAFILILFRRFGSLFVRIPLLCALASSAWSLAHYAAA